MGYRGRVEERHQARNLRAQAWTLQAIATELGVSKSSVSTWVRDVEFTPRPWNRGHPAGPKHPMRVEKEAEIERCRVEAEAWIGLLDIEADRFVKPYRAIADSSIRSRKHVNGCATVTCSDALLHRRVMARIEAVTSRFDLPG